MSVNEGRTASGVQWMRAGDGPPLVLSIGLVPHHRRLNGIWRRMVLASMSRFADDHTVWVISRPPGLPASTTMGDLSSALLQAIAELIAEPVDLMGMSTGASVAIRAAIDDPGTVRRLIVVDGACRLSPRGRAAQGRLADDLEHGAQRRGWMRFLQAVDGSWRGGVTAAVGGVVPGVLVAHGTQDVVATLRAEEAFDATARLSEIIAETLVVAGDDDLLYGPEPVRETAAGITGGHLHLIPRRGHGVASDVRATEAIRGFLAGW